MPFNTLLLEGLLPGTSFNEKGVNIFAKPQGSETILFFRINENVCRSLGIKEEGEPRCDLLIFYKKGDKIVLCLTEAKGCTTPHAEEQIICIYKRIHELLHNSEVKHIVKKIIWKAYICCKSKSTIKLTKNSKLKEIFGENCTPSHNGDIGSFLRR